MSGFRLLLWCEIQKDATLMEASFSLIMFLWFLFYRRV